MEDAKKDKEAIQNGTEPIPEKKLAQMELEPDEQCCVCYDTMEKEQNLTFCEYGCGKNIHTECMERWVRHKV